MKEVSKKGFRKDLGIYVRSEMEANCLRYYNLIGVDWLYEPREFSFPIKRGNRFYKPDFYLPKVGSWIEVKGFFRTNDKVKLRRFRKFYPEEFAKMWFIIPDKYAKSKANGEIMKFILDDLQVSFSRIIDYKEIRKYV